jgi:aminoglycoside phosphotransferase (APT) family kinase protein
VDAGSSPPILPFQGTPKADVAVDAPLVAALLAEQHSDLAGLALTVVDEGWDNVMFRLGEKFAIRLPRRAVAAKLIEHELAWLPRLAPGLPIAVPAPVRAGAPGCGYPWRWSVLPWIRGTSGDLEEPGDGEARALAAFFRALHVLAPQDAPRNPVRGVPLAHRRAMVEERLGRVAKATSLVTPALLEVWHEALEAPIDGADTWIHGDLHARNVLVSGGRICGIIDWSDMAAGDRATDLAAIWGILASRAARIEAIEACGVASEATWARARGWAFAFGVMLLDSGMADHPRHAAMGERTLRRLAEGPR